MTAQRRPRTHDGISAHASRAQLAPHGGRLASHCTVDHGRPRSDTCLVGLLRSPLQLGYLTRGGFFGEMAVMETDRVCHRTVVAQTDCKLRYLESHAIEVILAAGETVI